MFARATPTMSNLRPSALTSTTLSTASSHQQVQEQHKLHVRFEEEKLEQEIAIIESRIRNLKQRAQNVVDPFSTSILSAIGEHKEEEKEGKEGKEELTGLTTTATIISGTGVTSDVTTSAIGTAAVVPPPTVVPAPATDAKFTFWDPVFYGRRLDVGPNDPNKPTTGIPMAKFSCGHKGRWLCMGPTLENVPTFMILDEETQETVYCPSNLVRSVGPSSKVPLQLEAFPTLGIAKTATSGPANATMALGDFNIPFDEASEDILSQQEQEQLQTQAEDTEHEVQMVTVQEPKQTQPHQTPPQVNQPRPSQAQSNQPKEQKESHQQPSGPKQSGPLHQPNTPLPGPKRTTPNATFVTKENMARGQPQHVGHGAPKSLPQKQQQQKPSTTAKATANPVKDTKTDAAVKSGAPSGTQEKTPKEETKSEQPNNGYPPPLPDEIEVPYDIAVAYRPVTWAKSVHPAFQEIPKLLLDDLQQDDPSAVEHAMKQLVKECGKSEEQREFIFRLGGHTVAVLLMRKWLGTQSIQELGCRLMRNLTMHESYVKDFTAMVGGMESLVNAMGNFPDAPIVQKHAFGALANLFAVRTETMVQTAQRFVRELNGSQLVIMGMRRFPDDEKIQEYGCFALYKLGKYYDLKEEICLAGGLSTAATAYEHHRDGDRINTIKLMKFLFD